RAYEEILRSLYADIGGKPSDIAFVTGIHDHELAALYHHAIASVVASYAEGFSIPLLESIACGCPALASDCPAHVELVPQPEALFASDDTDRLAGLMARMRNDTHARRQLLESQRPMPAHFAEQRVAARFWRRVMEGHRTWRAAPMVATRCKPRLAFITP